MVEAACARSKTLAKLCHEGIKLFNVKRGKIDFVTFQIPMKRGQYPPYLLNLGIGDLTALFMVDEILLIDVR
jgi:hypothetical protein